MAMEDDRTRQVALAAGLAVLDEKHLAQLVNSVASGRELAGKLPRDLHWSEEIALIFRLPVPGSGKP
jgi:hypothetical protein